MGEANGVGIRTWAKVETEKLSKLSISGIKDNCPGLALVLKKKKKSAISIGIQSSDIHLEARELWNYKVNRTKIKPQCQAPSQGLFLMMTSPVFTGSNWELKTNGLKFWKTLGICAPHFFQIILHPYLDLFSNYGLQTLLLKYQKNMSSSKDRSYSSGLSV